MPVLVLNCGSSSIKYTLFDSERDEVVRHGLLDRVTQYFAAFEELFNTLESFLPEGLGSIRAVGHRVVHGGDRFVASRVVDDDVLSALKEISPLAPLHNPHNIRGIECTADHIPDVLQVAVFDTAFHATLPERARHYAIPLQISELLGIRRYGFHGISHQYVSRRALSLAGGGEDLRMITCHLGNGCSVSAVRGGRCVETSMGFTPLEGLVMGTRCGDLDPAVVLQLLDPKGADLSWDEVYGLLNHQSGLLGLSGYSSDVRDLLSAREEGDANASLALEIFTYRLKKYIGSYHAVLGGTDALVFTAGIGENAPAIRMEALAGMEEMGFVLDPKANEATVGTEGEISDPVSPVRILVIPTDEDRLIYEETLRVIGQNSQSQISRDREQG